MSWYLFRDAPAVQNRGIKIDGYQAAKRPKINLSWGINERESRPLSNTESQLGESIPTFPTTITNKPSPELENHNNVKVLTDTSEQEQEELMRLIKAQHEKKNQHDVVQHFRKNKARKGSSGRDVDGKSQFSKEQKGNDNTQIDKRIRYLQNSLLPNSRRDSMATIFDYNLNKEVPLDDSRVSGLSLLHNRKNDSNVPLGDGYNVFKTTKEPQKQLYQKFKDMYDYDENYKKRMQRSNVLLG